MRLLSLKILLFFGGVNCTRSRNASFRSFRSLQKKVTNLATNVEGLQLDIESNKSKHESEIKAIQNNLVELKNHYKFEIEGIKNEHKSAIDKINNDHKSAIEGIKNDHESAIDRINNDQKRESIKLRNRLTNLEDASIDYSEYDENEQEFSKKCVSVPKFEQLEKRFNNTNFSKFISLDDVLIELQSFKEECKGTMMGNFRQYFAALDCYIGDLKESQTMKHTAVSSKAKVIIRSTTSVCYQKLDSSGELYYNHTP